MSADPVAWIMIEEGWEVVGSDGEQIGRVKDVLGDESADIFDGLVVTPGLVRKDRYVPAENVSAIYVGRVELDLDEAQVEALDEPARAAQS